MTKLTITKKSKEVSTSCRSHLKWREWTGFHNAIAVLKAYHETKASSKPSWKVPTVSKSQKTKKSPIILDDA